MKILTSAFTDSHAVRAGEELDSRVKFPSTNGKQLRILHSNECSQENCLRFFQSSPQNEAHKIATALNFALNSGPTVNYDGTVRFEAEANRSRYL